jgi:hypothetical protein
MAAPGSKSKVQQGGHQNKYFKRNKNLFSAFNKLQNIEKKQQ